MGIALDHNFAANRFVYVCVSRQVQGAWRNQVISYHVDSGWKLDFNKFIIRVWHARQHHPQRLRRAGRARTTSCG